MREGGNVVSITRVFRAPVGALYRAWTDPFMLARWLLPGSNIAGGASADVRIGGTFRVGMRDGDGEPCAFSGIYTAVVPETLLSMTWAYQGPSKLLSRSSSVLCVRFRGVGDGCTELLLEHAMLDEPRLEHAYRLGWSTCLDKLDSAVSAFDPQPAGFSYSAGHLAAQRRYGSQELASTLSRKLVRMALSENDVAFIRDRDMLFLSTVDGLGVPTVSYKGGAPGFASVEDGEISFPSYDGNGMHLSIGNITTNPNVGLLFIDFTTPQRLRVHGKATIDDGPSRLAVPGADCLVRIVPTAVFTNCARYVHTMRPAMRSAYTPQGDDPVPFPAWKRIDEVIPSLPDRDRAIAEQLGSMIVDDYAKLLEAGQS